MSTKPPSLAALLESFFRNRLAAQRRASPATISTYRDGLRLLLVFASQRANKPPSRLSLAEIDSEVVLAFLDHLESRRGNSVRTRNARLAAIRSFFQHVAYSDPASMGIAQRVIGIPGKRTSRRVVGYLQAEELEAILAAPDRSTTQGRRDHALLLFLARTGARVSEAVAVNVGDLRLNTPSQVLLHGKGLKDRVIPLAADLITILRSILDDRQQGRSEEPLFVNAQGKRLTRFGVIHLLDRAVAGAGEVAPSLIKRAISPHTLRHTRAMEMLKAGVDLTTIQSWLGHAHVTTTHHYTEADIEMKRKALAQCDHPDALPVRYQPSDELLALLDRL